MLLTRFDPMKDFRDLEERVKAAFQVPALSDTLSNVTGFTPSVNTREDKDAYHVEVDLPGVKKEDIHVDIKDNVMTISGERKTKKEVTEKDYHKIESFYGRFQRSFTLPENTDADAIEAKSKEGVLEVVIPKLKKAEKETKKIEVK
ncbi:MAG: Hsp20/alpha crystallin family protein [Campylobacterales bacterium]|nr:Hsp20/alpha crystallin family protein [Campylobacterales bacterium]